MADRPFGICHKDPVARYGHFKVVRVGWRYLVAQWFYSDNMTRFCGLPGYWRQVNAERLAQALHLARQSGYDDGKEDARRRVDLRA